MTKLGIELNDAGVANAMKAQITITGNPKDILGAWVSLTDTLITSFAEDSGASKDITKKFFLRALDGDFITVSKMSAEDYNKMAMMAARMKEREG